MRKPRRPIKLALHLGLAAALAAAMVWGSIWWLDSSDEPAKADLIVLLGGADYGRPVYAAELWKKGLAGEVWLSRQHVRPSVVMARKLGVAILTEEEAFREILVLQGVPRDKIHPYGEDVLSTVDEARSLKDLLPPGKKVLVVTSRYHARRSRMIFADVLKGDSVLVCATPYEPFRRQWWRDKDLAAASVLEFYKTFFYFFGGRYSNHK